MPKDGIKPSSDRLSLQEMEARARVIRRHIVEMTAAAGSGHPGGSLSAVEVLTALYFRVLRHNPSDPHWLDRDRFILSKGHCVPVLYSVLAEAGYFDVKELQTFRKVGSLLQGHCHVMTPGVEQCAGSLGQGLSFGIGAALAGRLDGRDYTVYVMIGDGECDEGQVWEAAMAASHFGLDNLVVIVDRNMIQNDRHTSEAMEIEPIADKWASFGWTVKEIDGHDLAQVVDALEAARQQDGERHAIIAHTTKGKGVSFMEDNPEFHGKAPNPEQLQKALQELS
ncbi:MAG: transketolase [Chloroflexi bacterium]|nr:transketolase [Chloroflexota bacterium]